MQNLVLFESIGIEEMASNTRPWRYIARSRLSGGTAQQRSYHSIQHKSLQPIRTACAERSLKVRAKKLDAAGHFLSANLSRCNLSGESAFGWFPHRKRPWRSCAATNHQ